MYFGQYSNYDPTKTSTYNFYGLNRTRRTSKGEFADMKNMSSHEYPCATPRKPMRTVCKAADKINAIIAPDSTNVESVTGFTGISGGGFYYNGTLKSEKFTLSSTWSWQIQQKGNMYIMNGYDSANKNSLMYYYNIDTDEFAEGGTVMSDLIVTTKGDYIEIIMNDSGPVNDYVVTKPDGTVIKCSDCFLKYKDYRLIDKNGSYGWSVDTNLFDGYFDVGDEVTIEGFPVHGIDNGGQMFSCSLLSTGFFKEITAQPRVGAERNNTVDTDNMTSLESLDKNVICTATVKGFSYESVNGVGTARCRIHFDLKNKNGDAVEFKDLAGFYCCGITIKKRTRVLDNISIHHGRIWGSAPSGNQIYGSSATQLFSFSSEDIVKGFAVRIPSDTAGTVTGMCEYSNDLVVFKESSITIIGGDSPTNYYSYVIQGIGCIDPKSIAVTPSGVLFLSYNGFYIYSGNIPQLFSSRLDTKYISAVAGYNDNIYYVCAVRADNGKRELLTYNMQYNIWHILDDTNVSGFFAFKGKWYMADEIWVHECDSSNEVANIVDWSFTSVKIHDNTLDEKGLTELWIRCEMDEDAEFKVETKADNEKFKTHGTYTGIGRQIFRCPIRMNMCDNYQYRISGHGNVVFYEIETHKTFGGRDYKNSAGVRTATEKSADNKFLTY